VPAGQLLKTLDLDTGSFASVNDQPKHSRLAAPVNSVTARIELPSHNAWLNWFACEGPFECQESASRRCAHKARAG
jgi:hypothetical protein